MLPSPKACVLWLGNSRRKLHVLTNIWQCCHNFPVWNWSQEHGYILCGFLLKKKSKLGKMMNREIIMEKKGKEWENQPSKLPTLIRFSSRVSAQKCSKVGWQSWPEPMKHNFRIAKAETFGFQDARIQTQGSGIEKWKTGSYRIPMK